MGGFHKTAQLIATSFAVVAVSAPIALGQSDFQSRVVNADVVATGVVVSTTAHATGPAGQPGIHTQVTIDADGVPVVFWVHGGQLGNQRRVVTGQPTFASGESVVVLLFRTPLGNLWPMHNGTVRLAETVSIPGARVRMPLREFWEQLALALEHRRMK